MRRLGWFARVIAGALLAAGAAIAVGLYSCAEPTGPRAGTLLVELATPNADDGAIRLRVVGPGLSDAAPASGYQLYHRNTAAGDLEAVVVGNLAGGPLLSFKVPDVRQRYEASIVEVASRANVLRWDAPVGYTLRVRR